MSTENSEFKLGQMMPNFMGLNPQQIHDNLEGSCYGKEEGSYQKQLSEPELGKVKSDFAQVGLEISKIESEKKDAMEVFKTRLKEPKKNYSTLLDALKHKSVEKEGLLYLFDDVDTGIMYKVDEQGIVVDFRPMQQKEKQTVIRQLKIANGDD